MAVNYNEFLSRVIDDGIVAATADYKSGPRLEGALAGFEACRGLQPAQLLQVWRNAAGKTSVLYFDASDDEYKRAQCFEAEVEWVCNCASAVLQNEGRPPVLGHLPTARAVIKVAEILGTRQPERINDEG